MPRNDDGEFELILGNKQLLSVFFIVIILLGVFFTMGYIVGRNSGPPDTAKRNTPDGANPARTDGQSAMAPAAATTAPTPSPTVVEPVDQKPAETTRAAAPPPRVVETPKPAAAKDPIEVTAVSSSSVTQPIPGLVYVQVMAVAKPEAEVLAEVLAKKGFKAMVAPGPNDKVFRVLVGPAKDMSDAGKIKGDLEQAGFKLAIPKKF